MTPAEEKYVHHVSCIDDLNRAWSILQELRRASERTAVHAAAFAFALIEYAKPYTRSDGVYKQGRHGYALPPPDLEPEELALHHQILNLRRQAWPIQTSLLRRLQCIATLVEAFPAPA